jgi:hypothetical protein
VVSLLIHTRSEKFEAVDAAWTRDLMIVTELGIDGVQIALLAHLLWWKCLEALSGSSPIGILLDLAVRSYHRVGPIQQDMVDFEGQSVLKKRSLSW